MDKFITCDIFCAVVDNYGDIGVCFRLAKQLSNEHGLAVRLWVDDLTSFRRLAPSINPELPVQACQGIKVRHWPRDFPDTPPADLVIEAFACELPKSYVAAMAKLANKPLWVNLEYLSAEDWVEGCHKLPSPHPSLPLVKYFFFPGFTGKSGGLLLEGDLLARRDAFQNSPDVLKAFWEGLKVPQPVANEVRVSLFGYENPALAELFTAWSVSPVPVTCLVPEGRILPQLAAFFGKDEAGAGDNFTQGNLRVHILHFVKQEQYDELLWACDLNFVRGEDSCIRAQWAARPFVWHIYPQHDGVHMKKLHALLACYCKNLPNDAKEPISAIWDKWNGEVGGRGFDLLWNDFLKNRSILLEHSGQWANSLSCNNLASNLLDFFHEIGRIRAS
jgi:uncharacterized repeat protein (TIGR03837 family)